MRYRTGNHNPALVYAEHEDAEHFTPRPRPELAAVFVREGGENELDALHYVRAMNAEMPTCTCRVVCCCGALVGSTSGCETCMEHNGECVLDAESLAQLFHETYERLAPDFGYRTREASAKPWAEVPDANRALMEATCAEVLRRLGGTA